MLPKIKKVEFQDVRINDEVYKDNDLFLFANGIEAVDATKTPTMEDFEKLMLHEPDVVIFGTGFRKRPGIDAKIHDAAKKHKIELHVLSTPEAAKKFQELSREGRKTVAKLHLTC